MKIVLETTRLRLREFNYDDTDFIIALLNSPGWIKYIGDRKVKTQEAAISYLENGPLKSYKEFGYGLSMIENKTGNVALGMSGIINRTTLKHPDLGFALMPGFEGKGYAFEIADALIKYSKETLKLPALSAITLEENTPSRNLLGKLNFTFSRMFNDPITGEELMLYEIQLEEK